MQKLPLLVVAMLIAALPASAALPSLTGEPDAKTPPAVVMRKLSDFEGREEPEQRYIVATGKFEREKIAAITDVAPGTIRCALRYRSGQWWDGDRSSSDGKNRQRAEVKGLGPHQRSDQIFEYSTTWRTDPNFRCAGFCHVFQVKALEGDIGAPLITMTMSKDNKHVAVHVWSSTDKDSSIVRQFPWLPNTWMTVRIRVKPSTGNDGAVLVSVNGDEFQGKTGIPVFRRGATNYRPKWGLYRGVKDGMNMGDDWVEHRDVSARRLN